MTPSTNGGHGPPSCRPNNRASTGRQTWQSSPRGAQRPYASIFASALLPTVRRRLYATGSGGFGRGFLQRQECLSADRIRRRQETYDTVGRLFARHMGKYIPGNPSIIVQNAAGLQLANQFGNTTARDGTYFGVFTNGMPTVPLMDAKRRSFRYARNFSSWVVRIVRSSGSAYGARRGQRPSMTSSPEKRSLALLRRSFASFDYPRLTKQLC